MLRKKSDRKEAGKTCFLIVNLIISTIAFSFLVGLASVEIASGETILYWLKDGVVQSGTTAPTGITSYPTAADLVKANPGTKITINPTNTPNPAGGAGLLETLLADKIIGSAIYSLGIAGVVYLVSGMLGVEAQNQKALFVATFAGAMTYQVLAPIATGEGGKYLFYTVAKGSPWFGSVSTAQIATLGISVGVGLLILNALWTKESKKLVTFECKPYEAPVGGKYCELCNKDKFRPCSEYRCKSLGQACEFLNAGSEGNGMCAWVNRNDVKSATISPWYEMITKDYTYSDVKIRPPGTGMRIKRISASDGCVKAFTPLVFGISTDKPTVCKIDYNHTTTIRKAKDAFDAMQYYFGESNLYAYNHSQTLRLPGTTTVNETGGVEIIHDGTFTLYVRCQDANGNVNDDEFAIRFCVEKGPDTTPPSIEATSIPNGFPVAFNTNETRIEVYVNEPADCKWSKLDKDYEQMENAMACDRSVFDMNSNMLYRCVTTLTGLENRKDNEFYFRCKDQPYAQNVDRNTNQEGYKFVLKGSQPLNILSVKPNSTINGYSNSVAVDLEVKTGNGYNKGDATCYFSQTQSQESFVMMRDTGKSEHKQRLDLPAGDYTYYFKCVDLGGNTDYNQTSFSVSIDRNAPVVVRVYNDAGNLKIVTDEKSTCSYATLANQQCNFEINKGTMMKNVNATDHYTDWKPNTNYYIKCQDTSGNQPNPIDCSIIVRPYNSIV